ncbi:MAG: hypothetical protein H6841_08115 [Planctomycetes bacterium]|nr:hypothetical protein [Planctomycetota bacterium]
MSELPNDPMDELLRRAHNTAQGAPPEFMGRLRARMATEAGARKRARLMYIQTAAAVAAVVVIALVLGLNWQWFVSTQPTVQPETAERSNTPAPAKEPVFNTPDIRPEPQLPANTPPAKPGNSEQPQPPEEPRRVPEPEPEPTPEKPDDVVEQPKPDDTVEQPKPDDTVEQPKPTEPKQPEGTEVKPEEPRRALQISVLGEPKLRVKYEGSEWADYAGEELFAGVQLKARGNVDLRLAGGGLARFNGELQLLRDGDALGFTVLDDSLYVDNLETGHAVTVTGAGHLATMENGVGVFYLVRDDFEVGCIAGALSLADTNVEPGTSRRVGARGVGEAKKLKVDSFLKDIPPRVLLREDFDTPPPGGMYQEGERLVNGVAVQESQPGFIAFRYNPTLMVLPGTVLRMRFRTTDVSRLELELFTDSEITPLKRNEQRMFKHTWKPEKNGEWTELELRVEEIPERDDPASFPTYGTLLRNFKLHFTGKRLEIDWVEFVRVQ